ncbi:MAG: metal-dependent hydrolase [Chloroflexi bacterium]|nr:metal-dependent hydrolase [Chloroflexota bacterium]
MGPIGHAVVAAGIGAGVWAATGSPFAVPIAVAGGVLPDVDHFVDYHFDKKDEDGRNWHMFRLLHAWEYALAGLIVLLGFWFHPLLLALVLGQASHIFLDQLANRPRALAYSFLYRAMYNFERRRLTPRIYKPEYIRRFKEPKPRWAKYEPTLWRLYARLRGGRRVAHSHEEAQHENRD